MSQTNKRPIKKRVENHRDHKSVKIWKYFASNKIVRILRGHLQHLHLDSPSYCPIAPGQIRPIPASTFASSTTFSTATVIDIFLVRQRMMLCTLFLVACFRLYKLICRSVHQSVSQSLFASRTRLMAIGLVPLHTHEKAG